MPRTPIHHEYQVVRDHLVFRGLGFAMGYLDRLTKH